MRSMVTKRLMLGMFLAVTCAILAPQYGFAQAQNFDGTFPPTGFTAPVGTGSVDEGAVVWYRSDDAIVTNSSANDGLEPGRGGSGHAVVFNTWDIHGAGVANLVMDDVDLSGYANAELTFYLKNLEGGDKIRVYGRNASDSYVQVGAVSYGVYTDWSEIVISLTALSGGSNTTVDIRFEGTSDYGFSNIGLDDISIAEGVEPLAGSFDGSFPPTGFSAPVGTGTVDEGVVQWYRSDDAIVTNPSSANAGLDPGHGGTGRSAVFNTWDLHSSVTADLVMDNVDLSAYSNAELTFWMKNTDGTDVIRLYARNAADSYVQVGASTYGTYSDWTEIAVNLTAFSGGSNTTVDIRFTGTSDYGATNIGLDDVSVAEGPPPPTPMSGTYSVGPTGDYASLTAAFAAINTNDLSGAVILELQSTYTSAGETYPIMVSSNGTVTNTITVRPATGATGLVIETTTFFDTAIKLLNASYVTIDGRPGGTGTSKELAIKSTGGFGTALQLTEDAAHNVVKYCTFIATFGVAISLDASTSTGNSDNLITDCVLGGETSNPGLTGFYISGTTVSNVDNSLVRCDIVDCLQGISLETKTGTTLIDQCNFYTTSPFSGTGVIGIVIGEAVNTTIQRCKFYNLSCNASGDSVNVTGIIVGGGTGAGSSTTIKNNFFSLDGASTTDFAEVYAILYASAGSSDTCQIAFNTIRIGGTGITNGSSWGIRKITAASLFTSLNNIVINARSNGVGSGTHYAVAIDSASGVGTMNYNDYLSTGSGGLLGKWSSVNKTTLADWKTASSRDANSISTAVTFTAAGSNNLHVSGGSVGDLSLIGTPIAGMGTDIDGETRHATYPYMGADENVGSPLPVQISTFIATAFGTGAQLRWTTATELNNYGFEVERRQVGLEFGVTAWKSVGFVEGSGTSSSPREYSYVDEKVPPGRYAYQLKQVDRDGQFAYMGSVEVEVKLAPKEFTLGQNYPNPFNPSTTITYTLSIDARTTLIVFDLLGREVARLVDEDLKAGILHQAVFDGKGLPSGTYFLRLRSGSNVKTHRMVLSK